MHVHIALFPLPRYAGAPLLPECPLPANHPAESKALNACTADILSTKSALNMHGAADVDCLNLIWTADGLQALKARGEPLLSGFETTPEAVSAYFRPNGWQLLELLGPKCATFLASVIL